MTKKSKKWLRVRITSLLVFFLVLFIALVSRAFQLQIVSGNELKLLADRQHTKSLKLCPERGFIFDRNGEKLAVTVLADSVYVDPSMVKKSKEVSGKLSSTLCLEDRDIRKKLLEPGSFQWIARQVSPLQAAEVRGLDLDGVCTIQEPKRFYPHRELACHLLGFVGLDSAGLEGLELKYDKCLKYEPQKVVWGRDAKGNRIYLDERSATLKDGGDCNLVLTIDSKIQYIAEMNLKEAVENTGAKGGNAIVMDPKTGEILAMASFPQYNPNAYSQYPAESRRNRAITDCFDPGSIFKPFVAAAALEEGVVSETDVINCENGSYVVGDRVIHEAQMKHHEELVLPEILKYSSNIGIVKVAEMLGEKKFYKYITEFGFGSKTGVNLPGEAKGILRNPSEWRRVDFATMAFGQGISVTAIQLIAAMSAIANDGVLMKPYVVKGLVNRQGEIMEQYTPEVVRRVISEDTARRVTTILTDVVGGEGGTGEGARITNVSVAGKTGTSQKFDFSLGRYSSKKVAASFVGFFPSEDPQVVVLVMLDEPKIKRWGGVAAAPVFKNISERIVSCYNKNLNLPDVVAERQVPEIAIVQASISEIIPRNEDVDESLVPDFRGMSVREVLKVSQERGIDVRIVGSGWAVDQRLAPGISAETDQPCYVLFNEGF
jgi:cell division protein FtsI (penicillin-binding protein 3)